MRLPILILLTAMLAACSGNKAKFPTRWEQDNQQQSALLQRQLNQSGWYEENLGLARKSRRHVVVRLEDCLQNDRYTEESETKASCIYEVSETQYSRGSEEKLLKEDSTDETFEVTFGDDQRAVVRVHAYSPSGYQIVVNLDSKNSVVKELLYDDFKEIVEKAFRENQFDRQVTIAVESVVSDSDVARR